ncbi:TetR/AcrR family transcriptional regulator [Paenibacillus endoradicis]|uniref:TetR/AcrR family transcriptional regulator n=1 Tax=Paenibacillus endoradicis TaxID=2972487 RepID=UPI0021598483|nr:TetR/AcrR family transcriptional regulator [Paenibacillus endoradicis]MCR8658696.1 TetR/AcrR family transcriptional regulator [Paenibacillus endoradicis]
MNKHNISQTNIKKLRILEAASKVVLSEGVNRLTLEAVALEAQISKGGLLYHYGTKDELIKAMNLRVIEQFREFIEHELVTGASYPKAYLLASLKSLQDTEYLNISTSLLAAISNNHAVLDLWKEDYQKIKENFNKAKIRNELSLLIQATCDGIWFSRVLKMTYIDAAEGEKIIMELLRQLEGEST